MALTIAKQGRTNVHGNRLSVTLKVTLDNSYPLGGAVATNGYAFDLPTLSGIKTIEQVNISGGNKAAALGLGYHYWYDDTNKRLKVFESGHAASDQTPTADIALNALQSPMVELPNAAADLNGLIIYVTATGTRA